LTLWEGLFILLKKSGFGIGVFPQRSGSDGMKFDKLEKKGDGGSVFRKIVIFNLKTGIL
jgi:hypothetical protein